jgi:hypothetical protein
MNRRSFLEELRSEIAVQPKAFSLLPQDAGGTERAGLDLNRHQRMGLKAATGSQGRDAVLG